MNVVVDASAAFVMMSSTLADAILVEADELLAPDLLVPELLNARWKVNRAHGHAPQVAALLSFVRRVKLLPSSDFATDADALARRLDHPVYDCLYAAVAARSDATLITADARFAKKVPRHIRTAVVAP